MEVTDNTYAWLVDGERHFLVSSGIGNGSSIFLRYLPSETQSASTVLYVHGATFPSALSIAFRFDGRSWRDELCKAGFNSWALDLLGFGNSDSYPESFEGIPGRTNAAAEQIASAVKFILKQGNVEKISIIAHSWGCIAAGAFAAQHSDLLDRLVFFAPVCERRGQTQQQDMPRWRLITNEAQYARFIEDVPAGEDPVLLQRHFDEWAKMYLASDGESLKRDPPAVRVPGGPAADIADAWQGKLSYQPGSITTPLAIIRGEWDHLVTNEDALWLWNALTGVREKQDIKISRGTHLLHLEENRLALWKASIAFLQNGTKA